MTPGWYLARLRRMSVAEVAQRTVAAGRAWWWSDPARRPDPLATLLPGPRDAPFRLARCDAPSGPAAQRVLDAAAAILRGEERVFHLPLADRPAAPDWFADPLTGRSAPHDAYCFTIPHRDEAAVGNVKFVWEPSRQGAATLLACAWWLSGDDRFAERAALHLRSWWRANPFLHGVHWVSGIEAGLRLLAWSWIRALLSDWPAAPGLFEANDAFLVQLHDHSRFLCAFPSVGSSANNHRIAELAGLHAASLAFPYFAQSAAWARRSAASLTREAGRQTHADGWNREQASAYHVFVAEMLLAAALPARQLGQPLAGVERVVRRMTEALAASLDERGRPPRFGDGDDASGLRVDAPGGEPAARLLDIGRALWGAAAWWPQADADGPCIMGHIAGLLAVPSQPADGERPALFPDAGIALLRDGAGTWVRCDGGPHGFGTLAAHGHADALSVELRCDGVEVLADPGTFCYHGEPAWRAYFRGTPGHNTLSLDGADQARAAGPFLWSTQPRTTLEEWQPGRAWQARHDGYAPAIHRRRVELSGRRVTITDWVESARTLPVRLHFHFGPEVTVRLIASGAVLSWPGRSARMSLPQTLRWSLHRGEADPPLGWYSGGFGHRAPAFALVGQGTPPPGAPLRTRLELPQEGTGP